MAERRRRGEDPAKDRRDDDVADDALDEADFDDEDVADDVDAVDDDDESDDDGDSRSGRTATKTRSKPSAPGKSTTTARKKTTDRRPGVFARLFNFVREVVAELRKVIWPTRKELLTYTTVVVIFVAVMLTIVGLLDYGFAKAVLWVFGNKTTPAE